MSNKKYQVFISSTYSDLIEERRKILDILLMANCIPAGMEAFVATDNEQFEVIKKVIDLCDYYILIIGKRYGSVNPMTRISYTEMEYDYAIEQGIPVLVFAMDEAVELHADKTESEPDKRDKLKLFKEKAMDNRLATIWKSADDLIGSVAIAIMRAISEIPRAGWQRATDYDEVSLRREIMDLQQKNDKLRNDLGKAEEVITSFTEHTDVAFDDFVLKIKYHYYSARNYRNNESISISLPELFDVIAIQMLDVSLTEPAIESAILNRFIGSPSTYLLDDKQLIKTILNQLKALKLINSFWNDNKSALFWGLTPKGNMVRDKRILKRVTNPTDLLES